MSKPYHIIATEDRSGYNITIPENPNVSAHCADAADIMPTAAAKEQDERKRHEKTAVYGILGHYQKRFLHEYVGFEFSS